jgi:catechol 2,3-dioxygenase-like lactoylglutathione lyase family enzyme
MTEINLHHVSLLTGSRELADKCERFYHEFFGMNVSYSGVSKNNDFVFMADSVYPSVSPFEIIGKTAESREDRFLERHGPGLDHICFTVDDLKKAFEQLSTSGVLFHIPIYQFNESFIAWCKDPGGVEIELLQLGHGIHEPSFSAQAPKAQYSHVAIVTGSREMAEATEKFYRENFGMVELRRGGPSEDVDWVYLQDAGGTDAPILEIIRAIFDEEIEHLGKHGASLEHHCFAVDDVEQFHSWLSEKGVFQKSGVIDFVDTKMFYLCDPSGVRIQVLQRRG